MKCPKCGEIVYDGYTTEQRIKDLYNSNTTIGWGTNRLRLVIEMLEARFIDDSLPPVSLKWLVDDLNKTMNGLTSVADIENKRKLKEDFKGE